MQDKVFGGERRGSRPLLIPIIHTAESVCKLIPLTLPSATPRRTLATAFYAVAAEGGAGRSALRVVRTRINHRTQKSNDHGIFYL